MAKTKSNNVIPASSPLPRHVAVIMDGNGRWARHRGLPRRKGHAEGGESVRVIVRECARLGIEQLTLYAFSTENWKRSRTEVNFLMRLLQRFLIEKRDEMMEKNIRLLAIGRLKALPVKAQTALEETIALTRGNTGMVLRLAINYGGRQELLDAAVKLAQATRADDSLDPAKLTENDLQQYFYDGKMPDPDLLIRTGGELRLSNFLLWQLSYAELWFTRTCWPDFRAAQLKQAFRAYTQRDRRYGGLKHRRKQSALRQGE